MSERWIKVHQKFVDWEWYKNTNTKVVFLHCLLKANWKESKYQGVIIPRGSFATGRKKLAKELGLTEQQIRTTLEHLKSTNEITITSTNRFSIITINNYDLYQQSNQQINQQSTNEQPQYKNNRIINTNKEKEINKEKEKYGEFENVLLTKEEYHKLEKSNLLPYIEKLSSYIASKGKKYKSHYATILNWSRKDHIEGIIPEWFDKEITKEELTDEQKYWINYVNGEDKK